jgi:bacterioferritin-associated ferredoxin
MIVCVCKNVSDRTIRARAAEGATLGEILEETGAGSGCGTCRLAVARIHAGERVEAPPCMRRAQPRSAA